MATNWKSQQGDGMYYLQFETDDKDKYKLVEKASQMAIDGITDIAEVKHGEWIKPQFVGRRGFYGLKDCACGICKKEYAIEESCNLLNYCPNCGGKMDGGGRE